MRLIHPAGAFNGCRNMAADQALLNSLLSGASPPTLRFYRWEKPTVSTGYFQKTAQLNLPGIERRGWDLVRRPTGGRAVLHWKEVTFSAVFPTGGRNLWEIFRHVHLAIGAGLQKAGIPALVLPARCQGAPGHNPACFASPSRFELTLNGRKVAGTAQKMVRDCILVHGSIPIESTYRELYDVIPFPGDAARKAALDKAMEKMTSIQEGTGNIYDFDSLCTFIREGFQKEWEVEFEEGDFTRDEQEEITRLLPAFQAVRRP
jgi:lipoate-protein ligase A